jgi:Ala-tRNA(Pro) deacylase
MVAVQQQAMGAAEKAQFHTQRCGADWHECRPTRQDSGQTSAARQVSPHRIARVVLVRDPQGYAVVVMPRSRRLDLDQLNREFNRRFVRARPHEIEGLLPTRREDGLPPLGPGAGVETYLDEALVTVGDVYVETRNGKDLVRVEGEAFHELLYGAWCGRFSRAA